MLCTPIRHHWLVRINHDKMRSGGNSPRPACVRVYTIRMEGVSSDSLGGSKIMTQPCSHYAISVYPSQKKWQLLQEIAIVPFIMSGSQKSNLHTVKVNTKAQILGVLLYQVLKGSRTLNLQSRRYWDMIDRVAVVKIGWFPSEQGSFRYNNTLCKSATTRHWHCMASTWSNQCWGSHGNWLQ